MIVRMKHLDLVCLASEKDATLERLRALGAVHLDLAAAGGAAVASAEEALSDAEKAVRLILKARGRQEDLAIRPHTVAEVLAWNADRATLVAEEERLEKEIRVYAPYGDFDPKLAAKLRETVAGLEDVVDLPAKLPEMRLSRMEEKLARVKNRAAIDDVKIASVDERAILKAYPAIRDRIAFARAKALLADRGALAVLSG